MTASTTGSTGATPSSGKPPAPRWWSVLLWAAILIGIPAMTAQISTSVLDANRIAGVSDTHSGDRRGRGPTGPATAPPLPLDPAAVLKLAPDTAREINAAVPFISGPIAPARAFSFAGDAMALARATDCLAAAQLYEAGDDATGQRAVAQVVLNRLRHPAFPKTVCGVVFEGAERVTGCQFTFTCDGALRRTPSPTAWDRARDLASKMLDGMTDPRVGLATHYHTDWVVPYWSSSLDKVSAVDTHLFFRWKGWWGQPAAFRRSPGGDEPHVAKLAFLSPAHRPDRMAAAPASAISDSAYVPPDFSDLDGKAMDIGRGQIGERFGPGRLTGMNSAGNAFIMLLDKTSNPVEFETLARRLCAGRPQCRMLGWTEATDTPNRFPIPDDMLQSMSYAYLRSAEQRIERSLYNCREFSDMTAAQCMRERTPAG